MTSNAAEASHLLAEMRAAIDIHPFDEMRQRLIQRVYEALPAAELGYGTSVTYLLQQIHGYHFPGVTGLQGYYFTPDGGQTICPFTIAPRPYDGHLSIMIVSPRGPAVASGIATLADLVHEIDPACAIYVKNPPSSVPVEALARRREVMTPWNELAPFEDQTYPNVIVDLDRISSEISLSAGALQTKRGQPYAKLKQQLRGLERKLSEQGRAIADFKLAEFREARDWDEAKRIIATFFDEKDARGHLSEPVDYFNMFEQGITWRDPVNVIRALMTLDGVNVGLVAAERIGNSSSFGIYSLLVTEPPDSMISERVNISELQTMLLLEEISKRGGKLADLGGAETMSLQHYHLKFVPEREAKPQKSPVANPPWLQLG